MEEELKEQLNTQTETVTVTSEQTSLVDLPTLKDMVESEKQVKPKQKIEGLTQVENTPLVEDKPFEKVKDKKQKLIKRRIKIVSCVYVGILSLLLAFTGVNIATMVAISREKTDNAKTIEAQSVALAYEKEKVDEEINADEEITVSLNLPRDYSDDVKQLTFLDKITILFRNIFG